MAMDYFKHYFRYDENLADLTDEEYGKIMRGLSEYAKSGKRADFTGSIGIIFRFMTDDIDFAKEKYEEKCLKNQANGKLGGRPKKEESEKANGFSENRTVNLGLQEETEKNRTVISETHTNMGLKKTNTNMGFSETNTKANTNTTLSTNQEQEQDQNQEQGQGQGEGQGQSQNRSVSAPGPPLPPPPKPNSPVLESCIQKWTAYRLDHNYCIGETELNAIVEEANKYAAQYGDNAVAEIFDYSIQHGYKGLFYDRLENGKTSYTHISSDGKVKPGEQVDYEIKHHDEIMRDTENLEKLMAEWESQQNNK